MGENINLFNFGPWAASKGAFGKKEGKGNKTNTNGNNKNEGMRGGERVNGEISN